MDDLQLVLPAEFNLKPKRGLLTPRAFMAAVLEDPQDHYRTYGLENWTHAYAEPGYRDPERGILFGNWNDHGEYGKRTKADQRPSRFAKIAEHAGYATEWHDEWSTCEDCGKAVRTSPDSYSWTPAYAIIGECSLVCCDCIASDPAPLLEELTGDANRCLTADVAQRIDLVEYGYEKHNRESYESGLHPGQNDDPRAIRQGTRGTRDYRLPVCTGLRSAIRYGL